MTHPHPYMVDEGSAAEIAARMMYSPHTGIVETRTADPGLAAMIAASERYTGSLQTHPSTTPERFKEVDRPKPPPPQILGTSKKPGIVEIIGGLLGVDEILEGIPTEKEIFEEINEGLARERGEPVPAPAGGPVVIPREKPKKPVKPPKKPAGGGKKVRRCLLVKRKRAKPNCGPGVKEKTIPLEGKPGTTVRPGGPTGTGRTAGRVNVPPETPRTPLGGSKPPKKGGSKQPQMPKPPRESPNKQPVPGHPNLRFIWNGRFWNCWSAVTKRFVKCPPGVTKPPKR